MDRPALFSFTNLLMDSPKRNTQIKRALLFIKPYRRSVLIILGLTLAGAGLEAVEPLVLKYLFDELGNAAVKALTTGVGGLLLIGISREIISGVSNWLAWRVRLKLNYRLLDETVGRLHALPVSYYREESVGGIMTKLDRGINGFVGALAEIAFNVFPGLLYLVISVLLMISLDWRLAVLAMIFAPLPALIGMWAANEQTQREKSLLERWTTIFSRLNEVLSGILTVKSFAMEHEEKRKFLDGVRGANDIVLKGIGTDTRVGSAKNLVTMIARISAIAFGGFLIYKGSITVGTLIAFLGYIGGLFGPVQGLTGVYQTIRKASVALDTVFSILDEQNHIPDDPDATRIAIKRGEVVFDSVSFGYQKGSPILNNINVTVYPGETVALVGPSGGGKTTMMSLLQRLYAPTEGSIRVDGIDIRKYDQHALREQIGIVFQDAILFNDTVKNNIAYGRPGASFSEIEYAAKVANAHEFIMRLTETYETMVGERGGKLSVGERQRISIARAILKNPPILILDEATSSLDAESEAFVQDALFQLIQNRTTFIVAHRLSTVINADRILVLKNGTIAESGTHDDLMQNQGYYASLVHHQTNGLIMPSTVSPTPWESMGTFAE